VDACLNMTWHLCAKISEILDSQKCQFSHIQKNDSESYSAVETLEEVVTTVPDDESDSDSEIERDQPEEMQTNSFWCDYGLCDLQQILFKTKSDLKTHIRNHYTIGIEK
jgi:hypothetical protein